MKKAAYPCDLHAHTVRSDGNDTVAELIETAAARGVEVIAITDHDIIAPETVADKGKEIPLEVYGRARGVTVLRGIEFSCDTDVEDVHLVALGCDWTAAFFAEEHQKTVRSKIEGYRELCRRLTRLGMALDWQRDVLQDGWLPEEEVQRKRIFEAMAQKGYAKTWSDAKLMVKKNPRLEVRREKPNPVYIIEQVHQAGGIIIMAHPYLVDAGAAWAGETVGREQYIENLIQAGLDGIEASYTYNKTSYDGGMTPEQVEEEVRARYGARLPLISGGSDYHADGKKGVENPRELGERGLTREEFEAADPLRRLRDAAEAIS